MIWICAATPACMKQATGLRVVLSSAHPGTCAWHQGYERALEMQMDANGTDASADASTDSWGYTQTYEQA